jgi:2-dehydropantoate 2-reductase
VGSAHAARLFDLDPGCVAVVAGGERLDRYRREGITVNGRRYGFRLLPAGARGEPADLLLVAVKQHHLAAAVEEVRGYVGPATIVVSLLNGISSEGILGDAFGADQVLHAFVVGTDAVREGTVTRYASIGRIVFGAASNDPADPRVAAVRELFERAGIPHVVPADILREQWWKFMLNVGVNQVSAVLGAPYGAFALPEVGDLARDAMREVVALAGREGVALGEPDIARCFPILASLAPDGKTSMLQDVDAGRKTEVEIFAGAVAALGRKHGLPTPVNDILGRLIAARERMSLVPG